MRKLSIAAAVIAAFNKASLNNVLASAAVAIGAPAAATAFVYEVSALRGAQLAHEASDRSQFLHIAAEPAPALAEGAGLDPVAVAPRRDVGSKLDVMIASRVKMLDIFGDDPNTIAPIYVRIIKQMLSDDTATFAALAGGRGDIEVEMLPAKEARLQALHARLARLVGA